MKKDFNFNEKNTITISYMNCPFNKTPHFPKKYPLENTKNYRNRKKNTHKA